MNGVKNWLFRLLLAVLIVNAGLSHAAEREQSVSGAVYLGNEPNLGLTDLWLAVLSKQPNLKVLERENIRAILGELSLSGVGDDSVRQVRLGQLLGVEYFVWIKASDDQALMEVVEAATGRGIAAVPIHFAKGRFADVLPKLAEQAVQAFSQSLPALSPAAPSLAFSIPRYSVSNATMQAAVEKVIADLSGNMANAGITVLPRRFAADAVHERWRQEKGLVEDASQGQAFLGADYILGITVVATNRMELIMVEAATGRRVGKNELSLEAAQSADGLKVLNQWNMDRLRPFLEGVGAFPLAVGTNAQYASPEILKSLYAGMVLHNQGRYLDAIPMFEDSKNRKIRMDETDIWIVNCYRLAGFPEIADEVTENIAAAPAYKKQSQTMSAQSTPGVALLGVTADAGIPRGLAERTAMLLINSLHEVSEATVLAAEDIAGLRDEYDLLLGLDKVKGTTWCQAPPMLVREAITAHLQSGNGSLGLRLCLIRNCSPSSIYDVVTSLPASQAQWRTSIDKAIKELLAQRSKESPVWSPPNLKIEEDQQQLLSQLEKSSTPWMFVDRLSMLSHLDRSPLPWIYLKALKRNPDLTKYRAEVPWRLGLERWFLRVLPERHPDRPMLEFSVASLPFNGMAYPPPAALQQSRAAFQKIADKYPTQLAGLFSRYNLALLDMTPSNLASTEANISKLIPALRRRERREYKTTILSICVMDSALRYVLGLPHGDPDTIGSHRYGDYGFRGIVTVNYRSSSDKPFSFCSGTGFDIPRNNYFDPKTPEQMRVDLEVQCLMRDQGTVPARYLRSIIEKNGPNSDLARYAVVKYFFVVMNACSRGTNSKPEWPEEDLCLVYPVFAESLQKLLECEPRPISEYWVELLSGNNWNRYRYPDNPILNDAWQKAQHAVKAAFPSFPNEQPAKLFDASWEVGPLKDRIWWDYVNGKSFTASNAMVLFYPYLDRLHELYDHEAKSHVICRLYCQFGLAFFQAGLYDLAEPLFEQIISWRDYKDRPPEVQVHAQALYLLALLKQRNGDTPLALSLAKEALNYMDAHPKKSLHFYRYIDADGNMAGKLGYYGGDLKARVTLFIKQLRENPQMKFKSPYN